MVTKGSVSQMSLELRAVRSSETFLPPGRNSRWVIAQDWCQVIIGQVCMCPGRVEGNDLDYFASVENNVMWRSCSSKGVAKPAQMK